MPSTKHVIIGAGVAGVTAALTIKEHDTDAEVVLIGEERFFPYKRYLLTELLCESVQREDMTFHAAESFREKGIKLRKGQYVKAIDPGRKAVKFFHNEVMYYDKLLIATGGRPGLGPVLFPFRKNIQRYYSLKDIMVLKKKLADIQRCVVYGGGLSSLDLMRGLTNLGKDVTCIVKGPRVDFALAESEFAGPVHEFLEEKGIEIITDDRLTAIEPGDAGYTVKTLNKRTLNADIVFAWDYYKPNVGFISPAGTGIEKKLGILVNDQLETAVPDIYGAGDCVEIYHPGIKDYWINFGWPNAKEQGVIAGKNMAGQKESYKVKETIVFNLEGTSLKARWWK